MKARKLVLAVAMLLLASPSRAAAEADLNEVLSKLDLKLYGRVKFDTQYDNVQFNNYNDFIGAVAAGEDHKNQSVNFNPRDSRLGFSAVNNGEDWTSEARIETDFYGTNAGNNLVPRMRLGYVKVTNNNSDFSLLGGQDWIPVASLNPPTIDFGVMSIGGNLWWRVPQVTARKKLGDNWDLMMSLMKHRRTDTASKSRMPWLLGRVGYTCESLLVALGGGYRTENEDNAVGGGDTSLDRWLAALELKYSLGPVTFLAEPWIGQGIDDEWLRYELGVNRSGDQPKEIQSWGGFAAVTFQATEKVSLSSGYGIDDPSDSDLRGITLNDRQFQRNQHVFLNTWYSLTEVVKIGAELYYVNTKRDTGTNDGLRVAGSMLMSF